MTDDTRARAAAVVDAMLATPYGPLAAHSREQWIAAVADAVAQVVTERDAEIAEAEESEAQLAEAVVSMTRELARQAEELARLTDLLESRDLEWECVVQAAVAAERDRIADMIDAPNHHPSDWACDFECQLCISRKIAEALRAAAERGDG